MILATMQRNAFRKLVFKKGSYQGNEFILICFEDTDQESGKARLKKGGVTIKPDQWPEFVDIVNNLDITQDIESDVEETVENLSSKFSPF